MELKTDSFQYNLEYLENCLKPKDDYDDGALKEIVFLKRETFIRDAFGLDPKTQGSD